MFNNTRNWIENIHILGKKEFLTVYNVIDTIESVSRGRLMDELIWRSCGMRQGIARQKR